MHLLARESRLLDEAEQAVALDHAPADVVLLSFADADLNAAADAWEALPAAGRPSLRLVRLSQLRHPMSVDLYAERVIARSRCVLLRLIGGVEYWPYGAAELAATCRRHGVPLAVLPADARADPKLAALSTVPEVLGARLHALFLAGGMAGLEGVLRLAAHVAGLGPDPGEGTAAALPAFGPHHLPPGEAPADAPLAALVLYRSHVVSRDTAAVDALAVALQARGLRVRAWFVASLKEAACAEGVAAALRDARPAVVLNATGFSARVEGGASPLDAPGVPVLQLVLAGSPREAWAASSRGVSQADLAMQVVLPELDGRLSTAAIGFKAEAPGPGTPRVLHRPDPDGIALAAERAAGWARLSGTPRGERRLALVVSDYPGAGGGASGQVGHAVGLDTMASLAALLPRLRAAGWNVGGAPLPDAAAIAARLTAAPAPTLSLDRYRALLADLPAPARERLLAAWGDPAQDPAVQDGAFVLAHVRLGRVLLAVQPERGDVAGRRDTFHDPDLPPRHAYVAFYLWLREAGTHALLHLGAHGTLEWLPGKAVAPSRECFPSLLAGGLPVIYPFIASNPGEAAAAKRRLGAVTIGHLTPPLREAGLHGEDAELERLLDEYAAADGLDGRRTALLRRAVLERAAACGLLAEIGAAPCDPEAETLARLDAYLCDVKELRIRDGLHVLGVAPPPDRRALLLDGLARPGADGVALAAALDACADAERDAVLAALDGRFVAPGPAGAPARGRADVLPTGRNLFAVDPRAVPTRSAATLAAGAAEDLLRRHLQEHGDWPRRLVIDLWGSATMRTGGEDLALALHLLGVRPLWDVDSDRVTGVEAVPIAELDRPRVDVTLRISGLFRDAFPAQLALFDDAVRMIAGRDEAADWNPLAAGARGLEGAALRRATTRIYGAAPGAYGAGVAGPLASGAWSGREDLGRAWLGASSAAYGAGLDGAPDPQGLAARVAAAELFVHRQDDAGADLLDATEVAAHAGGFAAAAALLGADPVLCHVDATRPEAPVHRTLAQEVRRIVRGRAANPAWIAGMMRHGHRGAGEVARSVEGLFGFAATLGERLDPQFDLLLGATLADPAVDAFLRAANPQARAAMAARFAEAQARGLWRSGRNDLALVLG